MEQRSIEAAKWWNQQNLNFHKSAVYNIPLNVDVQHKVGLCILAATLGSLEDGAFSSTDALARRATELGKRVLQIDEKINKLKDEGHEDNKLNLVAKVHDAFRQGNL